MGEEEEDNSSVSKESSKGSIPRARQPRNPKPQQTNEPTTQGPHRTRPGRAERQRKRDVAEASAPTGGPSSRLNPSAPDFVPRQDVPVLVAQSENSNRGNRNRPRGGRRGKQARENESPSAEGSSRVQPARPPPRPRRNDNTRFRVQPKIIKESEDLMLRMTEALSKGEYDCSICTDSVGILVKYGLTAGSTIQTSVVMQNLLDSLSSIMY